MNNKSDSQFKCPKCAGVLEQQTYGQNLEYQRCENCAGLLMDKAAFTALKDAWLADVVIDIGDFNIGRKHDEKVKLPCPCCSKAMSVLTDDVQRHVCMDFCQDCSLIYLDAGEFTDLKHLTLMDYVWDFFAKWKS